MRKGLMPLEPGIRLGIMQRISESTAYLFTTRAPSSRLVPLAYLPANNICLRLMGLLALGRFKSETLERRTLR